MTVHTPVHHPHAPTPHLGDVGTGLVVGVLVTLIAIALVVVLNLLAAPAAAAVLALAA